ncbi:hypothetical protein M8C21_010861, partial [Ambrosia artemisiifolia]
GNWLEIASPDDPAVIEVGEFAVDEHNKDTNRVTLAENGQKTIGNWLEIASPDDPMVIEIGKFAVEEHNKESNDTLKFDEVIKGDTQIVGGMNW